MKNVNGEAIAKGGEIIKQLPKIYMEETLGSKAHLLLSQLSKAEDC
jgi:hypothetical protein